MNLVTLVPALYLLFTVRGVGPVHRLYSPRPRFRRQHFSANPGFRLAVRPSTSGTLRRGPGHLAASAAATLDS